MNRPLVTSKEDHSLLSYVASFALSLSRHSVTAMLFSQSALDRRAVVSFFAYPAILSLLLFVINIMHD